MPQEGAKKKRKTKFPNDNVQSSDRVLELMGDILQNLPPYATSEDEMKGLPAFSSAGSSFFEKFTFEKAYNKLRFNYG